MTKALVLSTLDQLPEEFSVDELFERLIVLQKIEAGKRDMASGKSFSQEEAQEKLSKWVK